MSKVFRYIDIFISNANKNIAVIGISLGVILVFVNVVLRYSLSLAQIFVEKTGIGEILMNFLTILNGNMTWAGELTNYLFIWSALFGAAYGFKKGIHISVTIMLNALPKLLAKALLLLSHIITFAYLAFSSYLGIKLIILLMEFDEISVDLNIPMWIPQLVLPITFFTAAFRAAEKVYEVATTGADEVLQQSEAELIRDSVIKD
ncbi:TRAP transporter, small permease subunit [Campylobacter blaseri]|uniref:C4-dicarboxylate ABC transporter permease n=1 Tax=Campylobacter blaseri TaxID=2042961 RepID=A0A2P8R134_9BACT|nr:TRAP transporter small permease [Campylobacter blaseri]PSM52200.1 C4-dicarboxylate ABC transporter permease [Campylobacter blaseri]PSM53966.1 C4-dicarboxylate ABC transporter permease [Campylobacter blaseri]QKF85404.1 TRAP transporter, small permease subunit [Campylobacter blaseri]